MNKKYKTVLIISIIVGVFIVGGAIAAKYYPRKQSAVTNTDNTPEPEQLTLCMLDGVSYKDKAKALRHPLAVIIENHTDARPQAGLIDASLVMRQ